MRALSADAVVLGCQVSDLGRGSAEDPEELDSDAHVSPERLVGEAHRLLEAEHAGGCLVEGSVLGLRWVRCVVGGDRIDAPLAQRSHERSHVAR